MLKGKIIWAALPMAASNAFGGWLGANWPLRKETALSEYFLVVVVATFGLLTMYSSIKISFRY
jgi:uncharacterized membrane protein YfcA